jgi:putative salt-induced outer membrane protein
MQASKTSSTLTLLAVLVMSNPVQAEDVEEAPPAWHHQVELGASGTSGNTQGNQYHAGYSTDYADDRDTWKFISAFDRAESNNELTAKRSYADLKKEWLWPENPWFGFSQGRYDNDDFKDWQYRFSLSGGIGYQHYKDDDGYIASRMGIGGNISRGDDYDVSTPELILALDANWHINQIQAFDFTTAFYPDLDNTGEYRNLTAINWTIKITEESRLALKLGLTNEYNSSAEEGTDHNDFTYNFSLAWRI